MSCTPRKQAQYGPGVVTTMEAGSSKCRVLFAANNNKTSTTGSTAGGALYEIKTLIAHPLKDPSQQVVPDPSRHVGAQVVVVKGTYVHKHHSEHKPRVRQFGKIVSFSKDCCFVNVELQLQGSGPKVKSFKREVLHVLSEPTVPVATDGAGGINKHTVKVPVNKIATWVLDFRRTQHIDLRLVRTSADDVARKLSGDVVDVNWKIESKCFRSGPPPSTKADSCVDATSNSQGKMCKSKATYKGVGCACTMTIRYDRQHPNGVTVIYDKCHNNHVLGSADDVKLLDPDDGLINWVMDLIAAGMKPAAILHMCR